MIIYVPRPIWFGLIYSARPPEDLHVLRCINLRELPNGRAALSLDYGNNEAVALCGAKAAASRIGVFPNEPETLTPPAGHPWCLRCRLELAAIEHGLTNDSERPK